MILGIGIDLVDIAKIAQSTQLETFTNRVFSPTEIATCRTYRNAAEHFAGKFAAKEALMKAIGHGLRQEVYFSQIEVLNDPSGKPYIQAHGRADEILAQMQVSVIHVSLTHAAGMAMAVVVLE